jgi:hypothetical protein
MLYYSRRYGDRFARGKRLGQEGPIPSEHFQTALCHAHGNARAMGRTGLSKTEADDLLDWLEASGCRHFEISSNSGQCFAVRWWN